MRVVTATLLAAARLIAQEPAPRALAGTIIPLRASVATISGVRELKDGRLLLSDAEQVGVFTVDAASGAMTRIGSVGGDALQYAQPGGFYSGPRDSIFLLDRGLAKVLVLAPSGSIAGSRSIKRRGVSGSSSADIDYQRVDSRGLAYFTVRRGGIGARRRGNVDSTALVRFDAATQVGDTVTFLRGPEIRVTQSGENFETSQAVHGSPLDEWGVTPDGRVVVVRGDPYRVEWYGADGRVVRGPVHPVAKLEFTAAEKDSITAFAQSHGGVSASFAGGPVANADKKSYFADYKAPFSENSVIVSPAGEVWVARAKPRSLEGTVYDVFDAKGERIDRVLLAPRARIVGFGSAAAYALVRTADAKATLVRYKR